jgi:hypothetical protein
MMQPLELQFFSVCRIFYVFHGELRLFVLDATFTKPKLNEQSSCGCAATLR